VASFLRATVIAVFSLLVFVVCLSETPGAAPQEPTKEELPVSLDRIREGLAKRPLPGLKLDKPLQLPMVRFKTSVEQRVYMLSPEEWLKKEFELTPLQRQSADWAARCCGLSLDPLFKSLEKALERRRVRKIREQIARELAEVEAARKKADLPDKR
jgi:hypothetical protein